MRRSMRTIFVGALLPLALGVAACGGGSSNNGGGNSGEKGTSTGAPVQGKKGGTFTELWAADVDFIDPGETYYQMGFQITGATQKALYGYKPDDGVNPVPDLAESAPQIASNGCKVTVKIKSGIKFSPPYGKVVTSKDVKYAIERGFFKTVNNGYAGAYFGDLKGAKVASDPGTTIPGITTPDDQTIVFDLKPRADGKCTGGVLAGALSLPLSAPVPQSYAAKFDKENPSTYGQNQLSTGPYMVKNDASGKSVGYSAGKSIDLVRNPNWDPKSDFRPAYVDEIKIDEGNDDDTVLSRRILDGQSLGTGDTGPPPQILRQLSQQGNTDQLALVPSGGGRWIGINNTIKPFDNVNVRRAIVAGFDRQALALGRGGKFVGDVSTHFIPPGVPGFDEAGGMKGPGYDFLSNPNGDPQLAASYMKKAKADGVPNIDANGKYTGSQKFLMVGDNTGVAAQTAQIAKQNFEKLGFQITLRQVTHDAMYTKFCNVPKSNVAVCPNVGWLKDFADAQTYLDPTFNGKNILPQGNSNWAQLNNPQINKMMDDAETISDPKQRAQTWADIDKKLTDLAPVVPWFWDKDALIHSKNVNGVANAFNAQWDLAFTSIK
jgi:peptide/nickel transport system substrate-binding protein